MKKMWSVPCYLFIALLYSGAASALTATASPTACASVAGIGTVAWTNPGNAVSSDNNYATASVDGTITRYLQCTSYGFAIPAGATINGISVNVERKSNDTANGGSTDAAMRLVKAGVIGGTDRSTATTYTLADVVEAHGGVADLWGTTWTAADVNAANFGAAFAATKASSTGAAHTVSVDHIQISIDYTLPVVINTYYPGTASAAAGATSITLGTATGAATPIAAGDLLLVMQMQDASIDATNTATYGDGVAGDPGSGTTDPRNSGLYEYVVATNAVPLAGGTLNLGCGTLKAYTNANAVAGTSGQRRFQVIRVPVYASYTLGAITALAWNGATGGVLAFDVSGTLTLNSATVSVDGLGFRGGAARGQTTGSGTYTDYRTLVANLANGTKGEGIAGTPYYVFTPPSTSTNTGVEGYPNGSFARGAPGNGGGGATDRDPPANDENPGGGGGANGGGGGIGGIGWCAAFTNTAPYYGCGYAALFLAGVNPNGSSGGFGGSAVAGLGATRLTLGGGGGSGTTNNSTGTLGALSSSGAAGGGIIMIRAGSMTGSATFNANGSNGDSSIQNDGSGGGGAGGVVMINTGSGMGGVTINVKGGAGGSNLIGSAGVTPHGPGGGGGGGYAISSAATAGCNNAGGASGVTYNNGVLFGAYGAMPGNAGACATTLTSAQIPGSGLGGVPACPSSVDHFAIGIGSASASTCAVKSITITAQNASNATVTNYTGTVNITTLPAHGDWSKVTANGTLTQAVADSGAASYQFVSLDNGVATLGLTNHHADGSLTITVVDNSLPLTSSTSSAISFSDNAFVITNDAIQVAGRPQAMGVAMWCKDTTTGICAISPYYTGAKNLKAWLTRDVDDPGGAAPTIGALSLPNALPGGNNLALTFTAGSASFNLGTADVGKYVLNLRDDSHAFASVDINGSSSTITTRPFALVVSGIKQGAVNNPAVNTPGGAIFAKAGSAFQATLGAYLWNSAADANVAGGDGIPDAGATLAQITANGATPSYRWLTTLSAGIPFTPATPLDTPVGTGTAGALSNGGQSGTCPAGAPNCFTSGVATPTNLSYNEVGSFTLSGTATNFLNTSGVNLSALVFDNSATPLRNAVVGRFIPDHFDTVVTGGMPCPVGLTCPTLFNGFVYSGQPFTTNVIARNLGGATTLNYDGSLGFAKAVTLSAWDNLGSTTTQNPPAATPGALASNAVAAAAFKNGATTAGTPATPTYTLPNAYPSVTPPPGPTDIYLRALDTDAVTSLRGVSSVEGGIKIVSGRVMVPSAYGSELLRLPVTNVTVQYYNGTRWVTSSTDTTALVAGNVGIANCQKNLGNPAPACKPAVAVGAVALANGVGSITLNAPGAGNNGSADLTLNAAGWPAWLPSATGRATFGIYKSRFIYLREMY